MGARDDLEELKEPKLLGGNDTEAAELRQQVDELRRQREALPAPQLDQAAAIQHLEKKRRAEVARIEQRRDAEVSILDKLIEKSRELSTEVKERTVAAVKTVGSFLGLGKQDEVAGNEVRASSPVEKAPPSQAAIAEELARQLEQFRAMGRQGQAQRELKLELAKPKPELVIEPKQELKRERVLKKEKEIEIEGYGHGLGR